MASCGTQNCTGTTPTVWGYRTAGLCAACWAQLSDAARVELAQGVRGAKRRLKAAAKAARVAAKAKAKTAPPRPVTTQAQVVFRKDAAGNWVAQPPDKPAAAPEAVAVVERYAPCRGRATMFAVGALGGALAAPLVPKLVALAKIVYAFM